MKNFDLDLSQVNAVINPDPNKIPVSGNEHRMVRVAFDIFRLKNNDPEELWQVQSSDDGEFLVRTYTLPEDEIVTSDWSANEDVKQASLTVSYKGIPVERVILSNFGISSEEDLIIFKRALLGKLSDKDFAAQVVQSLPEVKQEMIKNAGFVIETDPKLLELEKKLQKKAVDEIDEDFYESGIETYGPLSSAHFEADEEWEILNKTKDLMEDPKVQNNEGVKQQLAALFDKAYNGDAESLKYLKEILETLNR